MAIGSKVSGSHFPSMIVIFASLFTHYSLSPELDEEKTAHNMAGIPYFPPRTSRDRECLEEIKKF
jgi:hypothetical protein